MLADLKQKVLEANRRLPETGLVQLTWGNVSGIDRALGLMVIKPSGVAYAALRVEDMVVVSLADGRAVEEHHAPSSDTATHLEIYRAFPTAGGVCHTHSPAATAWSQAGRALPCYGTTHADHFCGPVPLCRILTPAEVADDYEKNTGLAIVETFRSQGLDPAAIPGVLQHHHAPFTWGPSAAAALDNSIALEVCARMALETLALRADALPLPEHLLLKHYRRKHGPDAYYGQKGSPH
jgi:L-ribulose-5-phosphate 4-epimerase